MNTEDTGQTNVVFSEVTGLTHLGMAFLSRGIPSAGGKGLHFPSAALRDVYEPNTVSWFDVCVGCVFVVLGSSPEPHAY